LVPAPISGTFFDPPMNEFSTKTLQFATFIHARKSLRYLRTELVPGSRSQAQFVFNDPDNDASRLEYEFESGATLPVKAVFASFSFLRRSIADVQNKSKSTGDSSREQSQPVSSRR
jgi:hypothetical protein